GPKAEACNHIVVDVPLNEAWVGRSRGEVEKTIDDEQCQDGPAPYHGTGGVSRLPPLGDPVSYWPGQKVFSRERSRRPKVESHDQEQRRPHDPQSEAVAHLPQ